MPGFTTEEFVKGETQKHRKLFLRSYWPHITYVQCVKGSGYVSMCPLLASCACIIFIYVTLRLKCDFLECRNVLTDIY